MQFLAIQKFVYFCIFQLKELKQYFKHFFFFFLTVTLSELQNLNIVVIVNVKYVVQECVLRYGACVDKNSLCSAAAAAAAGEVLFTTCSFLLHDWNPEEQDPSRLEPHNSKHTHATARLCLVCILVFIILCPLPQGVTQLSPSDLWDRLQQDSRKWMDGWMDGSIGCHCPFDHVVA